VWIDYEREKLHCGWLTFRRRAQINLCLGLPVLEEMERGLILQPLFAPIREAPTNRDIVPQGIYFWAAS
jgi:hypothetical protein